MPTVLPPHTNEVLNLSCLLVQLGAALLIGSFSLALFSILRLKCPSLHEPKSRFHNYSPPKLTNSLLGWVVDLFNVNEEQILELTGLDALMILRFFKLSRTLFSICSIYGAFVLLAITLLAGSVNIFGIQVSKDISTASGLDQGDRRLTAHCLGVYLFTLLAFYLFDREFQVFSHLRWSYLKSTQANLSSRTVLIQGVPERFRREDAFKSFLNVLNVGRVENVVFYQPAPELSELLAKRMEVLLTIEQLVTDWLHNPWVSDSFTTEDIRRSLEQNAILKIDNKKRPTLRTGRFGLVGKKQDAINYYCRILKKLDINICQARRDKTYSPSKVGFITFKSTRSAHYASQVLINSSLSKFRISLAPEPRDIIWSNLDICVTGFIFRDMMAWISTAAVIILYIMATSSICYLDVQSMVFPYLDLASEGHRFLLRCLETFLLPAFIIVFTHVTPYIFGLISMHQGASSYSSAQWLTASKHFIFLLIIWFFFGILPVCHKGGLVCFYKSSIEFETLVKSLLGASPLFTSFVMVLGLAYSPLQLLQPVRVVMFALKRLVCSTPRDFAELLAPVHLDYGWLYGQPMFVFVIVMAYSVYSPLILIFGTAYFFMGHLVMKYLLLYVFCRRYESGGLMWPKVFRRLMLGIFLLQSIMVGVFSLKTRCDLAIAVLPLLLFSIWFWFYISRSYPKDCQFLPADFLHDGSASQQNEFLSIPSPSQSEAIRINISVTLPPDDYLPSTARVKGVLDSSIVRYENPAIVGELSSVWLPCAISTLCFLSHGASCKCIRVSNRPHLTIPFTSPRSRSQRGSFSIYIGVPDSSLSAPCPPLLIHPSPC